VSKCASDLEEYAAQHLPEFQTAGMWLEVSIQDCIMSVRLLHQSQDWGIATIQNNTQKKIAESEMLSHHQFKV